jgi:hypothetical protein
MWYGRQALPISPEEGSMPLQERLDTLREASKSRVAPEARAVMQRSIDDLRASGIMDRIAKTGQPAPDFTLPNASGRPVGLTEQLARGPLVLSFYRGRW